MSVNYTHKWKHINNSLSQIFYIFNLKYKTVLNSLDRPNLIIKLIRKISITNLVHNIQQ